MYGSHEAARLWFWQGPYHFIEACPGVRNSRLVMLGPVCLGGVYKMLSMLVLNHPTTKIMLDAIQAHLNPEDGR